MKEKSHLDVLEIDENTAEHSDWDEFEDGRDPEQKGHNKVIRIAT